MKPLDPAVLTTLSRSTVGLKSMLTAPVTGTLSVPTRVAAPLAGSSR